MAIPNQMMIGTIPAEFAVYSYLACGLIIPAAGLCKHGIVLASGSYVNGWMATRALKRQANRPETAAVQRVGGPAAAPRPSLPRHDITGPWLTRMPAYSDTGRRGQ